MDDQFPKLALDKFRQWHFWWLVVFSFLLIIVFVYYLPTRFLQQMGAPHGAMPVDESQPHGHDSSGNSVPAGQGEDHMMSASGGEEMHEHMHEHMSGGMDMDAMMEHMMEMHDMTETEANNMMDKMMGHEHEEGATEHEHNGTSSSDDHASAVNYYEESEVKSGLVINLNISPVPYKTGVPLTMNFFVNNKPGSVPVPAGSLEFEHTKLMHVVGVRSDMNEFFHIHPESVGNSGVFSVNHTFDKPGLYKIWSDVKKDGVINLFGHPEVSITGTGPREEKNVSFTRNVTVNNYQVSLKTDGAVVKGSKAELSFDIHTLTGQEVAVEDYLGAQMHLVLIKDDWSQFIHTHPGGGGGSHEHSYNKGVTLVASADEGHEHTTNGSGQTEDEVIIFGATFPEIGLYKAFAQFRPQGINLPSDEAVTAEFWIEVKEKAALPISQWWGLLLVSVLLIAGLSWLVSRYLKVKPEDVTIKK